LKPLLGSTLCVVSAALSPGPGFYAAAQSVAQGQAAGAVVQVGAAGAAVADIRLSPLTLDPAPVSITNTTLPGAAPPTISPKRRAEPLIARVTLAASSPSRGVAAAPAGVGFMTRADRTVELMVPQKGETDSSFRALEQGAADIENSAGPGGERAALDALFTRPRVVGEVEVLPAPASPKAMMIHAWSGLAAADIGRVRTARITVESPRIERSEDEKEGGFIRRLLRMLSAPLREAAYLARAFRASYASPTRVEIAGGLVLKALSTILAFGVFLATFQGNLPAMAAAMALNLALNLFHGVWVNTWSNFQNNLGKERGLRYQTLFNLAYGQWWGAWTRFITWTAVPGAVPPWSPVYWKDMGISAVAGTFFGTLGIRGLNELYDKGRLSRAQLGAALQLRDLVGCLGGIFLGTGAMPVFWGIFAAQQFLDIVIYLLSRKAARKPAVPATAPVRPATFSSRRAAPRS